MTWGFSPLLPSAPLLLGSGGSEGANTLETFENNPLSGDISWTTVWSDGSTHVGTVTRTTTSVTQGTYSWRVEGTVADAFEYPGFESTNSYDVSGATTLYLDIDAVALGDSGGSLVFSLYDGTYYWSYQTGFLGAETLVLDLTSTVDIDLTNVVIQVYAFADSGDIDFYVDKLTYDGTITPLGGSGIEGELTATLDAATSSATAKVAVKGTTTATLDAVTPTATAKVAIKGTTTATLGSLVATSSGILPNEGAVTATLGDVTLSATGELDIAGVVNATLGNVIATSSGLLPIVGEVGATLGDLTLTATGAGASITTGELTATFDDLACTATGTIIAPSTRPAGGGYMPRREYPPEPPQKTDAERLEDIVDVIQTVKGKKKKAPVAPKAKPKEYAPVPLTEMFTRTQIISEAVAERARAERLASVDEIIDVIDGPQYELEYALLLLAP